MLPERFVAPPGQHNSMAELARLGRVSRARITQVMDLLMLAPDIQEEVLSGGVDVPLRALLLVCAAAAWEEQREGWVPLVSIAEVGVAV